jgi:M6 family metalloprotease-like protein
MRSQELRPDRLILLIAFLVLAPLAQAQVTDIRDIADNHVSSDIKNALYDSSPTIISKGDPDYPAGNDVEIPVETPDFPRNTYVTPGVTCVRFYLFPGLYYEVASGKAFTPKCHASGWATIATKLADYKSASGDPYYANEHPEFMRSVLGAGNVNWKQLDANSDGKISRSEAAILLLIPVRPDIGWASNEWQTIGKVKTSAGTFDFGDRPVIYLSVTKASLQDNTGYNFLDDELLTTIVHELLHEFFDLPDRYYDGINGTGLTGAYCNLSASSSRVLLNPHDRMKLGWIRPRILTPDRAHVWLKAPAAAATQAALILLDPARADEYWLLENRNRSGVSVESSLPTEGLAVWWVRAGALPNQSDDMRLVRASLADQDPDGDGIGTPDHPDWPANSAKPGYYWYAPTPGVQDLFAGQNGPRILRYSDGTPSKFGLYSISPAGKTVTLWIGSKPPPVVNVHHASAGAVGKVATSSLKGDRVATAVQDGGGKLKVIVWNVDAKSNIVRKGDASAGAISEVAIATLGTNRVVTAVRDGGGNLKVSTWQVDANSNVSHKGDASAGAISKVAIAALGTSRVVTAVRDGGGNLRVIVWDVDANGNISRKGDASAGAISEVSITSLTSFASQSRVINRVVTAVREGNGNLKVIAWDINGIGKVVRKAEASAGAISKVAATTYGPTSWHTFVRDGNGMLKVIGWSIGQDGKISRRGDASSDPITEVAATGQVSADRGGDGNLELIWWNTAYDAPQKIGSAYASPISQVAVATLSAIDIDGSTKAARVVTAVRDGAGNLNLVSWHLPYSAIH